MHWRAAGNVIMADEKFTRCPGCKTIFRVTPQQLAMRAGQVRCGHCHTVFDGVAALVSLAPQAREEFPLDEASLGPPTVTLAQFTGAAAGGGRRRCGRAQRRIRPNSQAEEAEASRRSADRLLGAFFVAGKAGAAAHPVVGARAGDPDPAGAARRPGAVPLSRRDRGALADDEAGVDQAVRSRRMRGASAWRTSPGFRSRRRICRPTRRIAAC